MQNLTSYHIVGRRLNWKLRKENTKRVSKDLSGLTKVDAEKAVKKLLAGKKISLKIHGVKGRIQREITKPRHLDPRKSKG